MKKSLVSVMIGLLILGAGWNVWAESSGGGLSLGHTAEDVQCNECVNETDIATGAVTSPKIADGSVTNAKIGGTISASKIEKPANVVVVAKSGGDYISIQAAIDSVSPSADNPYLIKVMPGTYVENITMKSYVHLQGAGHDITTIQSPSTSSNVITIGHADNVAISDISITGGSSGIRNGSYSPTISISRNKIAGNRIGIDQQTDGWISSRIIGNIISDNEERGIYTLSGGSTIIQNTITGSRVGIWEQGSGTAEIKGNIINGNTTGIHVDYLSSPNISENIITGNVERGIELYNFARAAIYRNTISGNAIGINVLQNSAATASFNICDDPIAVSSLWSTLVGIYNAKSDGTPVLIP